MSHYTLSLTTLKTINSKTDAREKKKSDIVENVALVEWVYVPCVTCMSGEIIVCHSGLCCCVSCHTCGNKRALLTTFVCWSTEALLASLYFRLQQFTLRLTCECAFICWASQNTQEVKNERCFNIDKTKQCVNFGHTLPLTKRQADKQIYIKACVPKGKFPFSEMFYGQ